MARSNNNNKLKAFVRFDGSGRIVSSSLIVQAFKPKVGNWKEIDAKECCNYVAPTTTSTTTEFPGYYTWLMGRDTDASSACGAIPVLTIYSAVTPLNLGVILYEDAALTIPVPIAYYATGGIAYETDITGQIISVTPCP
jgi:hypothetical protein